MSCDSPTCLDLYFVVLLEGDGYMFNPDLTCFISRVGKLEPWDCVQLRLAGRSKNWSRVELGLLAGFTSGLRPELTHLLMMQGMSGKTVLWEGCTMSKFNRFST